MKWQLLIATTLFALQALAGSAATWHVDALNGDDARDGLTPQTAWRSLAKVSGLALKAGDAVLLKKGCVFKGQLVIENARGAEGKPVIVDAYGAGAPPVINASSTPPGIRVASSQHLEIRNLEITADATSAGGNGACHGVLIAPSQNPSHHIALRGLHIHDIFAKTQGNGNGIDLEGTPDSRPGDILIEGCRIERTGRYGIAVRRAGNVSILGNQLKDIGGPGIQPNFTQVLTIRGNTVDGSGSRKDPRMYGRGSCAWIMYCTDVLVEKNTFMNAWGINDSCGFHMDIGNRNAIVQYNLSRRNAGGFIEILGNNFNCAYRYNISIDDGWRVKKVDGAVNNGHLIWVTGYTANKGRLGPFNSYLYNNTMYVRQDILTCFSIGATPDGLLIANNIFHVLGKTEHVRGIQDQKLEPPGAKIKNVFFRNNLYLRENLLPQNLPIADERMIIGDAGFARPGGTEAADYIPTAAEVVRDKGIVIPRLPGDIIGLKIGLEVKTDFFGNPINGLPDLGAVEVKPK